MRVIATISLADTVTAEELIAEIRDTCPECANSLKRCLLPEECGNWRNHDCGRDCPRQ